MGLLARLRGLFLRTIEVDTDTAVAQALQRAIAERGWATHADCAHIPIHRATRFRAIDRLVRSGQFRRGDRGRYYANPPDDASADEAPTTIKSMTTNEMLQEVLASRPEPPPLPDPRQQPVPQEHRAICPPSVDEQPREYFHDAEATWHELQRHLPVGTEAWARERFDMYIAAGNPTINSFNSVLRVDLPRHVRERGFEEVRRRLPAYSREVFNGQVEQFIAAGASLADALSAVLQQVEYALVERCAPPPPAASTTTAIAPAPAHPADEYGAQIAGRPRERANPERWYREQLQGYHQAQAEKDRARVLISMDQHAANTLVSGMVSACRGQHEEYARFQAAKKANDGDATPSLATRIRRWFD